MKDSGQLEDSERNCGESVFLDAEQLNVSEFRARAQGRDKLLHAVFALYRLMISPLFGQTCRFEPSCSHFVEESVTRHGLVRGSRLGMTRLLRCHPFHSGGYDPVP